MTTSDNPQLDLAFQYAQYTRRNIFLTGKAGTGKTTFLRRLQSASRKRMVVVAPTGVAAINAGGVTIHSFFQLAPGLYLPGLTGNATPTKDRKSHYTFSKNKVKLLRTLDLLIIDEISMVRCDLLDAIDDVLRRYQDRDLPFGGVQLLMIGDLQQLAPVTTDDEWPLLQQAGYTSPYFFGSKALRQTDYTTIELRKVYRQADPTFVDLLNEVRDNRMTPQTLDCLNQRFRPGFRPRDDEGYITLTTHNYQAQDINQMRLTLLDTPARTYTATVKGDFPEGSFPTEQRLTLKVGAQVMFCKNDPQKVYYNGKIGHVMRLEPDRVVVHSQGDDGQPVAITCTAQEWSNTRYKTNETTGEVTEEEIGSFTQIPLKPAWAITIHKSQGLTFDRAIINAGRAFSPGQVYVALSRCRSLEGLVLATPITPDVISVDPTVVEYNKYMAGHQPTPQQLVDDRRRCIYDVLCQLFDFRVLISHLGMVLRLYEEYLQRDYPIAVGRLRETAMLAQVHLADVGSRFQHQIAQFMPLAPTYEENVQLQERVQKAVTYFTSKTAELLQEFISEGLPETDNKAQRERLERDFDTLRQDYELKMNLFLACDHGFSLDAYWNAKAAATVTADGPDGKKASARGKGTGKAKVKAAGDEVAKVRVNENDDIKHPQLFAALRQWRNEKAATLGIPAFAVLRNDSLIGLANLMPTTSKDMLAIPHFGKKSLSAFGREVLEIIERYKATLQ